MTEHLLLRVGFISSNSDGSWCISVTWTSKGGDIAAEIVIAQLPVIMLRLSGLRLEELVRVRARFNLSREDSKSAWKALLLWLLVVPDHVA